MSILWENERYDSPEYPIRNGVVNAFHKFDIQQIFNISDHILDEAVLDYLPKVILMVFVDGKPICYRKFDARELQLERAGANQPICCNLRIDHSVSKLRKILAGEVCFRAIAESSNRFVIAKADWQPLPTPYFHKVKIVLYLLQAQGLLSSDNLGSSDPVVQFYHFGSSVRSQTQPETLSPVWNQRLVLDSYMYDTIIPPIQVTVWDQESAGLISKESFEYLGGCSIKPDMSNVVKDPVEIQSIPEPRWVDIKLDNGVHAGKVLIAYQIVAEPLWPTCNINLTSKVQELKIGKSMHHVKILAIGLRNLQPGALSTVKQAEIHF